jgi:hypothetical protein
MRNGDLYKIQGMEKAGSKPSEIVHYFRNRYDEAEVTKFLAKPVADPVADLSESDTPIRKKKARKRITAKG